MIKVDKKLSRMRNPGTNNKNPKGKNKKVVISMKDMFRDVMEIMMAQLEKGLQYMLKKGYGDTARKSLTQCYQNVNRLIALKRLIHKTLKN